MTGIVPRHAQVFCPVHGTVGLSAPEYHTQMVSGDENWRCPTCDSVAIFDHDFWARTHDMPALSDEPEFPDVPF